MSFNGRIGTGTDSCWWQHAAESSKSGISVAKTRKSCSNKIFLFSNRMLHPHRLGRSAGRWPLFLSNGYPYRLNSCRGVSRVILSEKWVEKSVVVIFLRPIPAITDLIMYISTVVTSLSADLI